jgi:16S rRNA processing protein RimM
VTAERRSSLEIGQVLRPHGLRGGVVVRLVTDQVERVAPGTALETDNGELTVLEARPLKDRFVVTFDGVETLEAAERLRGTVLRSAPLDKAGTLWVDELVGSTVRDTGGTVRGVVVAVEPNPASDLLVLDTGALVPARFVVGTIVDGVVTVDPPEGLFE